MTVDTVALGFDSQFGSSVMEVDARMHEAPIRQMLGFSTEPQPDVQRNAVTPHINTEP